MTFLINFIDSPPYIISKYFPGYYFFVHFSKCYFSGNLCSQLEITIHFIFIFLKVRFTSRWPRFCHHRGPFKFSFRSVLRQRKEKIWDDLNSIRQKSAMNNFPICFASFFFWNEIFWKCPPRSLTSSRLPKVSIILFNFARSSSAANFKQ